MTQKTVRTLSHIISSIGHPVLLVSVFVTLINFREYGKDKAIELTITALGVFVIPVVLYILYKMKKGDYGNFDVSERKKRNSLYPVIIVLQVLLIGFLYLKSYSWLIKSGAISSLFLTVAGFIINQRIKVSMHTTVAFFIAVLLIHVENSYAFSMLFFATAIAYSRVLLGRHTFPEIILGTILGLVSGAFFHFII
ncbi:phosphatase PAP2 family protein [Jiulongibacter sp. NS-SX5]|uniref:phosphatase PAP2 family protein n=1 Tax=Jiulongibacter sp. NS-SX5 TaxID=3463854 RepID=UPI00405854FB